MANPVGLSGALEPRSRLSAAVGVATSLAVPSGPRTVIDFSSLEPAVRAAPHRTRLSERAMVALLAVEAAPGLIMGLPTRSGTIDGLFKHFLDLADPDALRAKPVLVLIDRPTVEGSALVEISIRLTLEILGLRVVDFVPVGRHEIARDGEISNGLLGLLGSGAVALRQAMARGEASGPNEGSRSADVVDFLRKRRSMRP